MERVGFNPYPPPALGEVPSPSISLLLMFLFLFPLVLNCVAVGPPSNWPMMLEASYHVSDVVLVVN